jgi:hypothetical protein
MRDIVWRSLSRVCKPFGGGNIISDSNAINENWTARLAGLAVRRAIEENQRQIQDDAASAVALVRRVADAVGEPVIARDADGHLFGHPALLEELQKPENKAAADILLLRMPWERAPEQPPPRRYWMPISERFYAGFGSG